VVIDLLWSLFEGVVDVESFSCVYVFYFVMCSISIYFLWFRSYGFPVCVEHSLFFNLLFFISS
jgi:hypothetical protein